MGLAGIRNIAVFGLAFGLCLDFSGSPGTAAEYEQAVEQVATECSASGTWSTGEGAGRLRPGRQAPHG